MVPIVSVVMAVYNEENTVAEAIESIIAQTFYAWELIIIDDASTDSTQEIVRQYASLDKRIRIFRNKKNYGLAVSLNKGIRRARGKYIARMDGDDFSYEDRLEKQVAFMENYPDVDVLGAGAELVDNNNQPISFVNMPEYHCELSKIICKRNTFFHSSIIMRKEFIERAGGYNEKLRKAQDYDLWGRMCRKSKFHNLQEPLIRYRTNSYQRPIKTILYGFYVHIMVAKYNQRILLGGSYALLSFFRSLLIKFGFYVPGSFRGHS